MVAVSKNLLILVPINTSTVNRFSVATGSFSLSVGNNFPANPNPLPESEVVSCIATEMRPTKRFSVFAANAPE
ncbi:hypothetical protein D3C72_2375550 [compost metagenome]